MNQYEVRITDSALNDMERIYEYISQKLLSFEYAMGQYNRIAAAILSLSSFPERFALIETEPEHSLGIRHMIVDNYLVCYLVDSGIRLLMFCMVHQIFMICYVKDINKSFKMIVNTDIDNKRRSDHEN